MEIIAVKQRPYDAFKFDIIYRDKCDKFYSFESEDEELLKELGSGKHKIFHIPKEISICDFLDSMNTVHFNFKSAGLNTVGFEGPSHDKIFPVCQN